MSDIPYPIELTPPDIEPYREGNTGIEYVSSFAAGRPGPHLVINALAHGNELSGAVALDALMRRGIRPRRGRLTLVLANTEAYRRFDPAQPMLSRFVDEDFNRLWEPALLGGPTTSAELRRARRLLPVYAAADILLDLHSMQHGGPPLMLCGLTRRSRQQAQALRFPQWVVADAGHPSGRRLLDYGPFAEPGGAQTALLVECGQHWARATGRVALEACLRLLLGLDMIDPAEAAADLSPAPLPAQRLVEVTRAVTATTDSFRFVRDFASIDVVGTAGTVIAHDGVQAVTTPYADCVLVMPARRPRRGQTAVRLGRLMAG